MRVKITLILILISASVAGAQSSYPVFSSKADSLALASVQKQMTAIAESGDLGGRNKIKYDSLLAQMNKLISKAIRIRTLYAQNKNAVLYQRLKEVPDLSGVGQLSVRGDGRATLPDSIFMCVNLEELELVGFKLEALPPRLNELTKLRKLTLLNNLPAKPLKLFKNSTIKELVIRGDENQKVPVSFRKFRALEALNLSNGDLTSLPDVRKNQKVKRMVLVNNQITLEGKIRKQKNQLSEINLHQNKVKVLPSTIARFTQLKKLNLNYNPIEDVKPGIEKLTQLEELSFYKSKLKNIPSPLFDIPKLKVIDLYFNDIEKIGPEIAKWKNLEILYLANNKLFTVPEEIGSLTKLRELYLHHNRLSTLPASIGNLQQVSILRINHNNLLELPEAVFRLHELSNLDFSHNQIQTISPDQFMFINLRILALVGNPWDTTTRNSLPAWASRLRSQNVIVHLNTYDDEVENTTP